MSRSTRVSPPTAVAAFTSPIGTIVATASDLGLRAVGFDVDLLGEAAHQPNPALDALARWLDAYFRRQFDALPEVPLDVVGVAADQLVWAEVREIQAGRSRTYGDLAASVGRRGAARAIGGSVGRNPSLLVIPCHRVTGGGLSLTGYSGGIERKAWLLRHEGLLLL